jgi:thymidine phosphorylase
VEKGEPLMTLHVNDRRGLAEAEAMLRDAVGIAEAPPPRPPLVHAVLD